MTTHEQLKNNSDGQLEEVFFNREMAIDTNLPAVHHDLLVGTLNKLTISGLFQTEINLRYHALTSELKRKLAPLTKRKLGQNQTKK